MDNFMNYLVSEQSKILGLLAQHVELTFVAIILAILIGVPLGILISHFKTVRNYVLAFINIVQAVPSMALLGLLVPVLGIGSKPAIFMVVLYSLLPIVKNTTTGILGIDEGIIESATGIGLTPRQVLFKIQLPLALPIIMAGIRISAVSSVGLMTLSAFVGAGGLGYLVFSGVQTVNDTMILAGAIPACILALLVDFIFSKIEIAAVPEGISLNKKAKKKKIRNSNQRAKRAIGISAAAMMVVLFFCKSFYSESMNKDTIVVGCKDYTEQLILGNMYADILEEYTDYNIERRVNLGTSVLWNAMVSKEVDVCLDYTGTILVNIMKEEPTADPNEVYERVKKNIDENYDLALLSPLGFNNTYTLAMKPEIADKYGINTYSDLAKHANKFVFSPTLIFENRDDGLPGLKRMYDMNFKAVKSMDGGLRYQALESDEAQVIDAFSTDGLLEKFKLKVLEDDKNYFPPYYAAPVVNKEALEKYPDLEEALEILAGKIDEATMTKLNYEVDELGKSPESVARQFLIDRNLIKK